MFHFWKRLVAAGRQDSYRPQCRWHCWDCPAEHPARGPATPLQMCCNHHWWVMHESCHTLPCFEPWFSISLHSRCTWKGPTSTSALVPFWDALVKMSICLTSCQTAIMYMSSRIMIFNDLYGLLLQLDGGLAVVASNTCAANHMNIILTSVCYCLQCISWTIISLSWLTSTFVTRKTWYM